MIVDKAKQTAKGIDLITVNRCFTGSLQEALNMYFTKDDRIVEEEGDSPYTLCVWDSKDNTVGIIWINHDEYIKFFGNSKSYSNYLYEERRYNI